MTRDGVLKMMEESSNGSSIGQLIDTERELALEQSSAATHLHIERVMEELVAAMRIQLERILDDRFVALKAKLDSEVRAVVADAVAVEHARGAEETLRACDAASRATTERLNQAARQLDRAEDFSAWTVTALDSVALFVPRAILFSLFSDHLRYEGHREAQPGEIKLQEGIEIPLESAPSFKSVLETMDTVVSMGTASEISPEIANALSSSGDSRMCILPVIVGQSEASRRVAAFVLADGGTTPLDINVLELIVSLAGASLDARQAVQRVTPPAPEELVEIQPAEAAPAAAQPQTVDWSTLSREEQELHAKAQRFARVRVAEMRLYQPQAVRQGREQKQLYSALRSEVDRARSQFKIEYFQVPSMIDYFHLELVRTLANDDPEVLGSEYPGPLS